MRRHLNSEQSRKRDSQRFVSARRWLGGSARANELKKQISRSTKRPEKRNRPELKNVSQNGFPVRLKKNTIRPGFSRLSQTDNNVPVPLEVILRDSSAPADPLATSLDSVSDTPIEDYLDESDYQSVLEISITFSADELDTVSSTAIEEYIDDDREMTFESVSDTPIEDNLDEISLESISSVPIEEYEFHSALEDDDDDDLESSFKSCISED